MPRKKEPTSRKTRLKKQRVVSLPSRTRPQPIIPSRHESEDVPTTSFRGGDGDELPSHDSTVTQLSDLPNEILVKILKNLPLDDQRIARRVSRRWRSNLNTPAFFRDVTLCDAAPLGITKLNRYLKTAVSVETRSLTLSCRRTGTIHVLANISSATILANKCPLLEKVTFKNGVIPVDVFRQLPATVKLVCFSYICVIDQKGRYLYRTRQEEEVEDPMVGPNTLYRKLTAILPHGVQRRLQ